MANRVVLTGRLTREPEVRYTQGAEPMAVARYTLAVDRGRKDQDGNTQADFPSCVAFGKNGEFAERFLRKGMKILVEGRVQTGSYEDKDGKRVYTTDIVVERHEFCESKKTDQGGSDAAYGAPAGFDAMNDEDLPF